MRTDTGPLPGKVNEDDRKQDGRKRAYAYQRYLKSTGGRSGEESDRATWRRKISSYTGDPMMRNSRGKEFSNIVLDLHCARFVPLERLHRVGSQPAAVHWHYFMLIVPLRSF